MRKVDYDTRGNRQVLIKVFQRLGKDPNFRLLSEDTREYNCIAWAMQYVDRWVDFRDPVLCWWPTGVECSASPEALVKAFEAEGFRKTDNPKFDPEYDKVVLYKRQCEDGQWCWTHASRLVAEGLEYSKFGELWDGQHSSGTLESDLVDMPTPYGCPYAYMERHTQNRVYTQAPLHTVTPDLNLLNSLLNQ